MFRQDMPFCDKIFKHLEEYDEMALHRLALTKIGKVIRHIENKVEIPRQEEFRFQERAKALAKRWCWLLEYENDDYSKGSDSKELGDVDASSPILHDMVRARRSIVGDVGGLREIIVENAAGGVTSVILPYF
jgi:hypothetical protein